MKNRSTNSTTLDDNTVKAGYNEPSVPAIFVRYRMSSLYSTYII